MKAPATAYSVIEASARSKWISGGIVIAYALLTITPLLWIVLTSFSWAIIFFGLLAMATAPLLAARRKRAVD